MDESNEMRLLKALINELGYDIQETTEGFESHLKYDSLYQHNYPETTPIIKYTLIKRG